MNENDEVMQEREEMTIYDVKARLIGETSDLLFDEDISDEEREKGEGKIDKYLEFVAKQEQVGFNSDCRLRELDQKDQEIKIAKRRQIFDYVKLGVGVTLTVGSMAFAAWTRIRDYQMQNSEGYMPSDFGKICSKIADQFERQITPKI